MLNVEERGAAPCGRIVSSLSLAQRKDARDRNQQHLLISPSATPSLSCLLDTRPGDLVLLGKLQRELHQMALKSLNALARRSLGREVSAQGRTASCESPLVSRSVGTLQATSRPCPVPSLNWTKESAPLPHFLKLRTISSSPAPLSIPRPPRLPSGTTINHHS